MRLLGVNSSRAKETFKNLSKSKKSKDIKNLSMAKKSSKARFLKQSTFLSSKANKNIFYTI